MQNQKNLLGQKAENPYLWIFVYPCIDLNKNFPESRGTQFVSATYNQKPELYLIYGTMLGIQSANDTLLCEFESMPDVEQYINQKLVNEKIDNGLWFGFADDVCYRYISHDCIDISLFDAIELDPVAYIDGNKGNGLEVIHDDTRADFWSVYLHLKTGGVDCIADFKIKQDAVNHAQKLSKLFSLEFEEA